MLQSQDAIAVKAGFQATAVDFRRYCIVFAIGTIASFLAFGLINFVIDPFQFFRQSDPPRFARTMQRHQHPGLVRNYPFDTLIAGASPAANLRPSMINKTFGPDVHPINLIFWGGTVFESVELVRLALATKPLKMVFWEFGYQTISADYRYPGFPNCLYYASISFFPYCYLFNLGVFKEAALLYAEKQLKPAPDGEPEPRIHQALRYLGQPEWGEWVPPDAAEQLWAWLEPFGNASWAYDPVEWLTYGHIPMSLHKFACEIQQTIKSAGQIDAHTEMLKQHLDPIETPNTAKFARLIFPLLDAHPETRFIFFVPPLYVGDYWQGGASVGAEYAFIKRELIKRPNVEVYNFQGYTEITHNIAVFRDSAHPDAETLQLEADAMAEKRFRVTDLASEKEMLRRELDYGGTLAHSFFDQQCP